ncbi:phosphotransferase [Streptomyces cacaoi]|uniref:phosphotransferase n=1 Tax=Streptomyces cacaoi TaxID=1898 RepID=UPI003CC826EE
MRLVQPSSLALTEGTLHSVLRQYDVGAPLSCDPVSQGLLNRGYRLTTTRGRFFLKHHLDGDPAAPAGPARIERQHRAAARLGALGLPVVPAVADPEGRTVAVVSGRCYALHPWVEGRHRYGSELSAAQCGELGALLGRVHTRLAEVLPQAGTPSEESADPAATYEVIGELLVHIRARLRRDSFDELAEHRLTERRELLRRYAGARPPVVPARFHGWVHGDFHPLNLLYGAARTGAQAAGGAPSARGEEGASPAACGRATGAGAYAGMYAGTLPAGAGAGAGAGAEAGVGVGAGVGVRRGAGRDEAEPVAILDWDRLGVRPRAEEAVRGAAIFFVRPDGTLDLRKVRAYARAYRRWAGASRQELAAAVHRVWWERLNDFWMLRWRYQLRDVRADPQFPAAAALVVWWSACYEAVRSAFCD